MAASYISVPRDLTKVKSKIILNLTKRQIICFSVGASIGTPAFFLLRQFGSNSVAAMGMMIVMMPLFFLAMYEKNGQPLEVFLGHFINATFKRPKRRPYKTNNYYSALIAQARLNEEVEKIVSVSNESAKARAKESVNAKGPDKTGTKAGKTDNKEC